MLVESTGPTSPPPRVVEGGQGANLPELLTFLIAARRLILSITAAVVVAGLLYAKIATPIYRSDTLIQVEEKKKGIAGLEDLNALMPSDNAADAEIEILRSRSLVGEVVRKLSLDLSVTPRHFPLVGEAIARAHRGSDAHGGDPRVGPRRGAHRDRSARLWRAPARCETTRPLSPLKFYISPKRRLGTTRAARM